MIAWQEKLLTPDVFDEIIAEVRKPVAKSSDPETIRRALRKATIASTHRSFRRTLSKEDAAKFRSLLDQGDIPGFLRALREMGDQGPLGRGSQPMRGYRGDRTKQIVQDMVAETDRPAHRTKDFFLRRVFRDAGVAYFLLFGRKPAATADGPTERFMKAYLKAVWSATRGAPDPWKLGRKSAWGTLEPRRIRDNIEKLLKEEPGFWLDCHADPVLEMFVWPRPASGKPPQNDMEQTYQKSPDTLSPASEISERLFTSQGGAEDCHELQTTTADRRGPQHHVDEKEFPISRNQRRDVPESD